MKNQDMTSGNTFPKIERIMHGEEYTVNTMTKIFLTGATGYIGGQALHSFASSTAGYQISCLVRDAIKGDTVRNAYPKVRIVVGDLDDFQLIKTEAENADVVFNLASTNHIRGAKAIAEGISAPNVKPGYWIQMSGATMVCADEVKNARFGESPQHMYDDLQDVSNILSLIRRNPGRAVDNLVLAQDPTVVRTALLIGPLIYGQGLGPVNQRSIQAPEIARCTLTREHGFQLGQGKNVWSNVHIHDLGALCLSLLHAANTAKRGVWNDAGIYFPTTGAMSFGELCSDITQECHKQGFLQSTDLDQITAEEADAMSSSAAIFWGTNAVLNSSRARRLLSWKPSGATLLEELPKTVQHEASSRT